MTEAPMLIAELTVDTDSGRTLGYAAELMVP